jgi:argininosuccinate synthase
VDEYVSTERQAVETFWDHIAQEVNGTVGIAVEDGYPAITSLPHMVRHAGDYCTSDSGHSS